ncbi:hypothetical protein T09_9741 [Trichinella sp. T9]|nr:hypothetical protein T09_9741 [Trichinella sp. T9]
MKQKFKQALNAQHLFKVVFYPPNTTSLVQPMDQARPNCYLKFLKSGIKKNSCGKLSFQKLMQTRECHNLRT